MARELAVVTGATSGIDRVGAAAIAEAGYDLILPCRSPDKGEAVKADFL